MRTLLRNIPSGLYFEGPDKWTSNPEKAFNFKRVKRALKFVEEKRLEQMELAFVFENPGIASVPVEKLQPALRSSNYAFVPVV